MTSKKTFLFLAACSLIYACNSRQQPEQFTKMPESTLTVTGSVHELTLNPAPPPAFPEHEGKAEFTSYCSMCHTLRYISMQPAFPAKVWKAEVDKMVAKYHAPIDSVNAKKITDYLVAVKGV